MALCELAQHIVKSTDMFVEIARTGQGKIAMPAAEPCETAERLLDLVRRYTERTKAAYGAIDDATLAVHFDHPHPNFRGPREKLLVLANDHEVHHKGQLYVYARMLGAEQVPFFIL